MHAQHPTAIAPPIAAPPGWPRLRQLLLALAVALFTYASAWTALGETPFGVAPDEWAHATYVHEVAAGGRLIPDYAGSHILPGRAQGNYLSHPPLYYSVLGLAGRVMGWDAVRDYRAYRKLSALMVAFGMLLWMLAGSSLGMPPTWLLAAAAATNAFPMFPFLAGSINNDNLAFLGVAIAVYGLVQLRHWPRAGFHVAALGVLVAFLTKATASVFLCVLFACWIAWQWREDRGALRSRHLLAAAAGVVVVAGGYFLYALLAHGALFPHAGTLYVPNPPAVKTPLGPFAITFAGIMAGRLPTIMSHASVAPLSGSLLWAFWIMLAAPLLAALASVARRGHHPDRRLVNAFFIALAVTVFAHLLVVWRGYLATGLLAGMQPRYYNYVVPALFIFCFLQVRDSRVGKVLFAAFALSASLLLAVAPALSMRAQVLHKSAPRGASAAPDAIRYPRGVEAPLSARIGIGDRHGGHVDQLVVSDGKASIRGWAINAADRSSARGVLVVVDDRLVGSVGTGKPRADVGKALGTDRASRAGFHFTIDGLPATTTACDIHLAAEQNDGSLASLTHTACATAAP